MQLGIKHWLTAGSLTVYFNVSLADNTTLYTGNYNRLETIAGLDFPALRTATVPRAQQDGDILLDSFRGARYVTLAGMVRADTVTAADTQAEFLRNVLNQAVRADATLRWLRRDGVTRQALCRCWEGVTIEPQGALRQFQFVLVMPDPVVYNDVQSTVSNVTPATQFTVTNGGDADTYPLLKVYGNATTATTAFSAKNNTSGELVRLTGLAATDLNTAAKFIQIDMNTKTVVHSDGRNMLSFVDFTLSDFWPLLPGANLVQIVTVTGGNPSKVDVVFRDAWIGG